MKSPKEARPKSSPKPVTYKEGWKPAQPMATGRITPTGKTSPDICNCKPKG